LNLFIGILFLAQKDMGGLLITFICSGLLLFLSGLNYRRLFALIALAIAIVIPLILFSSYRLPRIMSFLQPDLDPSGSNYQIKQSLIGIGSGGIFGKGYGQSLQKTGYLPEVLGDSVFVVLVEELGLVGGGILVVSFLFFAFIGFRIAKRAPDDFSKLCAVGITVMITSQAFINIGAISGLIPLTGLTLPLVSYGSSSYVITLFSLGILANISKYTKAKNI
jgi:cell division protein FtsW